MCGSSFVSSAGSSVEEHSHLHVNIVIRNSQRLAQRRSDKPIEIVQ